MKEDCFNLTNSDSSEFTRKVTPVSQKVTCCYLVQKWNCSQDSYPHHCVSQWVRECYQVSGETCLISFNAISKKL